MRQCTTVSIMLRCLAFWEQSSNESTDTRALDISPPPRKEVHEAALQWFARTKTLMPAIKTVSRRTARPSVVWPWHNKVCALRIEA